MRNVGRTETYRVGRTAVKSLSLLLLCTCIVQVLLIDYLTVYTAAVRCFLVCRHPAVVSVLLLSLPTLFLHTVP